MELGNCFTKINWGIEHPCYGIKERADGRMPRIAWTPIEVEYIGQCVDQLKMQGEKTPVAKCRMQLLHHEKFHAHFHREHVLNLSKFGHGYKSYCNKLLKITEKDNFSDWGFDANNSLPYDADSFSDDNISILEEM
jgi:hypothetical protein